MKIAAGANADASVSKLIRIWPWLAAALSGALYAGCFAPFDQSWLCWFALAPLVAAVWFSGRNAKRQWLRALLLGYLAGVVFFTITFSWLGALGTLFDNVWLHGLPALLSIYLALWLAFWAWFVELVRPKSFTSSAANLGRAMLAAAAWVTQEWIRGWLFTGFGWNGLGIALHRAWPLLQIAQFTGVAGLSFLIATANVIAVTTPLRLFQEARTHRMRPHWDLNLTVLAVVALFVFGWHSAQVVSPVDTLQVAAVQADIPQQEKFDPIFSRQIFDAYSELSALALRSNPPRDLLVWPEAATPDAISDETSASAEFVMNFASRTKTDLLLGTLDVNEQDVFNAAALLRDRGREIEVYHKVHLVPFGEYIPLRHSFPLFAAVAGRWVPGDFNAGTDYKVLSLTKPDVRVAPLVCFEDTVGDLTRQFVDRGANLLVNMTNDGWFLHSAGSQQHLANAVFRCAETQRPMLRAANTGVTAFVNAHGRVTQFLQDDTGSTFTRGVLIGEMEVPRDASLTFYARHGELFSQVCAAITGLAIFAGVLIRRWQHRPAV